MINEVMGHDKRGKKIILYYGSFQIKGVKTTETIMTNNYKSKKLAEKKLKELEQKYLTK
jgi:hypothetical protein